MDVSDLKHYLVDAPPSVVRLEIEKHFEPLGDKQKRYAHFISRAAFEGTRVILRQVSPESEPIVCSTVTQNTTVCVYGYFDFILALYRSSGGDWKSLQSTAGISDVDLDHFFSYAAQFLGNNGNYKSFGDAKFIPRYQEPVFAALAATSPEALNFYKVTSGAVFFVGKPGLLHLGYPDQGHMTTYYPDSPDITQTEIEAVSKWMEQKKLLPENTRLLKSQENTFEILVASADTVIPGKGGEAGKETEFKIDDGILAGKTLKLVYGDYSNEMVTIAAHTKRAAENGDNENQRKMYGAYTKSFKEGSLLAYKDSQRFWIRDQKPSIESSGEWEGFAAVVNIERTRAFEALVDAAPSLIPLLPWGKDFEKDKFLSPDFTSLEVLSFAGSGIPAGINLPNYDDIRQTEGFKNVSLGNVLSAKAPNEKIPFITEEDLEVYQKYCDGAFEVQVGLHELTGHGCGKLLQETSPGVFNFDQANPPISPLTQKPVTTWYKPGQAWGSVFGSLAGAYEECRAELVAMFLSCEFPVLKIFGFGDGSSDINSEAGDVLYALYLKLFEPKSKKWGQPHSQARFSILQCFLQAGDDFCKLEYQGDSLKDAVIKIDRSKIPTVGRKAVGEYLQKLHIYKVTADVEAGTRFFAKMTDVDPEFWGGKVRDEVLANKQPRKVFVQANTFLDEATGKVTLKHYEATPQGMIQSWAERQV
ncbi:hypothetical protein RRF57_010157 [Xylaria bambusicola]|uniref:Dipeptidyl peptidase 3 n=1 Tax=Xylaria bambusicola TaxID=326684 RepID=A0AAN7UW76_9PEZI